MRERLIRFKVPCSNSQNMYCTCVKNTSHAPSVLFTRICSLRSVGCPANTERRLICRLGACPSASRCKGTVSSCTNNLQVCSVRYHSIRNALGGRHHFLCRGSNVPANCTPRIAFISRVRGLCLHACSHADVHCHLCSSLPITSTNTTTKISILCPGIDIIRGSSCKGAMSHRSCRCGAGFCFPDVVGNVIRSRISRCGGNGLIEEASCSMSARRPIRSRRRACARVSLGGGAPIITKHRIQHTGLIITRRSNIRASGSLCCHRCECDVNEKGAHIRGRLAIGASCCTNGLIDSAIIQACNSAS